MATCRLWYGFSDQFENGDARNVPGQFNGLRHIIDPARRIDLQGAPLTRDAANRAMDLVRSEDGAGDCAIVTSGVGWRALCAVQQNAGYLETAPFESIAMNGGRTVRRRIVHYNGWPILVNDFSRVLGPDSNNAVTLDLSRDGRNDRATIWFIDFEQLRGIYPATPSVSGTRRTPPIITTRVTYPSDPTSSTGVIVYTFTMAVGIALLGGAGVTMLDHVTIPGV